MPVPVVYHPEYFSDIGEHVFPAEKYGLIRESLGERVEGFEARVHRPEPATREQLLRVHAAEYLDDLDSHRHTARTLPSELPITAQIVSAYYLMTGGTCLAAELALERGAAMNLGGGFHHAFADRAEGFCYVNDVAVGTRAVLAGERGGRKVSRVAVVDGDLHQGNGTAHIFREDPAVFTFSIHQENNYPIKRQSDLDVGLRDFTDDERYLGQLQRALDTIFSDFEPEFVLYVGGVDPYENDQLGGLKVTKDGMKRRDTMVFERCRDHGTPVAAVLAGGYAWDVRDTVELHMNAYFAMSEVFA